MPPRVRLSDGEAGAPTECRNEDLFRGERGRLVRSTAADDDLGGDGSGRAAAEAEG